MNDHPGLHAWHLDMRDARRRGLRRGIALGFAVALLIYWIVR